MAVIQPRKQAVIKKGINISYDPATFTQPDFFYETDDPQFILDNIEPFEINGRKFVVLDTETHPTDLKAHDLPSNVVRRWVGTGKSAKPQDFPFCISICDGKKCFTIYDSYEDGFEKFKVLKPILENASIEKIAHNAKDLAL